MARITTEEYFIEKMDELEERIVSSYPALDEMEVGYCNTEEEVWVHADLVIPGFPEQFYITFYHHPNEKEEVSYETLISTYEGEEMACAVGSTPETATKECCNELIELTQSLENFVSSVFLSFSQSTSAPAALTK